MFDKLKLIGSKAVGGKEAIEWIMVLFLAGLLGGASLYVLVQYQTAINDSNVTGFIDALIEVFDLIPTWVQILVIVGFASAIALVGLGIYAVFRKKTSEL